MQAVFVECECGWFSVGSGADNAITDAISEGEEHAKDTGHMPFVTYDNKS